MNNKLKLLPVFIMLVAGAFTSIITWLLHYERRTALWILVGVLVLFYILGLIIQKTIHKFEVQIHEEEVKRAAEEEGKVVEKEKSEGENATSEGENNDSDAPSEGENASE